MYYDYTFADAFKLKASHLGCLQNILFFSIQALVLCQNFISDQYLLVMEKGKLPSQDKNGNRLIT